MVCKLNQVYSQRTEAKKVEIFRGTPLLANSKQFQNPKKKGVSIGR